jgi:hypothetical protein
MIAARTFANSAASFALVIDPDQNRFSGRIPTLSAIWLTLHGRVQVLRLPVAGGTVTSVGSSGASYADFGANGFWNPVTRKFSTFNGYGWMAVRNWRWKFWVGDLDWVQSEPNTPGREPWPRQGGYHTL